MLRGVIVGLGNVAVHAHVPAWSERKDIEIVAATDLSPGRRAALESRLPGARWYDSADDLLVQEAPDFVDICTPPGTHAELIRTALRQSAHVLCEKPLVASLEDLTDVTELASASERVLFTVHNWRHAPILTHAHELVRRGEIGRLRRIRWETTRREPAGHSGGQAGTWRADPAMAGGGILVDHGWHAFYLVQQWAGQAPIGISARLETRQHTQWPVEDTATIRLEFPDATADVFLTWASDQRRNWIELEGTRGTLRVEDDVLVLSPSQGRQSEQRWLYRPALSNGSYHPDWFHGVASEFVAEVNGSTRKGANLAVASVCVALQTLARESNRRNGDLLPVGS
jgi:predicted dehydrogenase